MACANYPTFQDVHQHPAALRRARPSFPRIRELLRTWFERSRQRRALIQLDDRLLRDIGVTRTEAVREAAKPFWLFKAKRD